MAGRSTPGSSPSQAVNRGQRVPLILEIHGGPNAAYGPQFRDRHAALCRAWAMPCSRPIRAVATSYGAVFANLIDQTYPGADYDDLIASVDAAITHGTADPDNLFVTGGSGGGC